MQKAGRDNKQLLGSLLVLCLLDLVLTSIELHFGLITEANPIMDFLAKEGILPFIVGKLLLTSVCAGIMHTHLEHRLTRAGLKILLGCYTAVLVLHILGLLNELT